MYVGMFLEINFALTLQRQ